MNKYLTQLLFWVIILYSCDEPRLFKERDFESALSLRLDNYVSQSNELPGAFLSIQIPGETSVLLTSGISNISTGEPLSTNQLFRIASITKMFTSVVVLQLVEEGKLALDDPVEDYLDEELLSGIQNGSSTIRDLLQHTSGIDDYVQLNWIETLLENPQRFWLPKEIIQYVAANGSPQFQSGQGYFYSDTNYILLGLIIEQLTNQSLHGAYASHIFNRLSMDNTYLEAYNLPDGLNLSSSYFDFNDLSNWNTSSDWAGGGLVSNLQDLTTFMRALMDGEFFDNSSTQVLMQQWLNLNSRSAYGLGIGRYRIGDNWLIGHGGQGFGFTSGLYYWPEKDAVIVMAVNQQATSIEGFETSVINTIQDFY